MQIKAVNSTGLILKYLFLIKKEEANNTIEQVNNAIDKESEIKG
jgi:hypothetical protein